MTGSLSANVKRGIAPLLEDERRIIHIIAGFFAFAIVTMKLAPHMAGTSIQMVLPQMYILLATLLIMRVAYFSLNRILLYILFICGGAIANLLSGPFSQLPSFFFVVVIYITYTVELKISKEGYKYYLNIVQWFGIAASILVFMDWAFQLVGFAMPSLDKIIPDNWIFFNYVYIQPLEWGNSYMKPNGLFFLETSYISQFLAFCLAFEICLFRRLKFLMTFSVALVSTFGGTGLLLFALCVPVIIFYLRIKLIPILLIAMFAGGIAAVQLGVLDNVEQRTEEFGKPGSSGNMRFTNQWNTFVGVVQGDTEKALVGHGAGVMLRQLHTMVIPPAKVAYEYGLIVFPFWFLFIVYCMFGRGVPFIVSWAMLMQYLFLNGSFLVPINNYYIVIMACLFRVTGNPKWSALSDFFVADRSYHVPKIIERTPAPSLGYSVPSHQSEST
jgi:hypothetical protein